MHDSVAHWPRQKSEPREASATSAAPPPRAHGPSASLRTRARAGRLAPPILIAEQWRGYINIFLPARARRVNETLARAIGPIGPRLENRSRIRFIPTEEKVQNNLQGRAVPRPQSSARVRDPRRAAGVLAFGILFELVVYLSEIIEELRIILPLCGGLSSTALQIAGSTRADSSESQAFWRFPDRPGRLGGPS